MEVSFSPVLPTPGFHYDGSDPDEKTIWDVLADYYLKSLTYKEPAQQYAKLYVSIRRYTILCDCCVLVSL